MKLWNYNTENHTENLNSIEIHENLWNCTEILIQKKYTMKKHWKFVFIIQVLIFALC